MTYKIAETDREREGHFAVRREVFVDEQGMFEGSDRDEYDEAAIHIVAIKEETGEIVGAVRCYEAEDGIWYGGRLAVCSDCRRAAGLLGLHLVKTAEDAVRQRGCRRFLAFIQMQNVRFFQHLGWKIVGPPEDHYGQTHQTMEADLYPETARARSLVHA